MQPPEQAVSFRVPGAGGRAAGTGAGAGAWTVGSGTAAASVTAALPDMYLGLWGRSNLQEKAVIDGDAALALRVLREPLTP